MIIAPRLRRAALQKDKACSIAAVCGQPRRRRALAFVDIDSTQRRVYGHAKQGAAFGHTKIQGKTVLVRGLNALAATVCTPLSAPLIAEAVKTARQAGCAGTVVVRTDSAHYSAAACHAARRAAAFFSVTARLDPAVKTAIAGIAEDAWTRSTTRAWSGTTSSAAGYRTPRSPRPGTPRSRRGRARRSPPG